jgi:hypothetical protein
MKNKIKIYRGNNKIILKGNHKCHAPVEVEKEAGIFRELHEITKYFFPEPFEWDYSGANLKEETIQGLEGCKEQ